MSLFYLLSKYDPKNCTKVHYYFISSIKLNNNQSVYWIEHPESFIALHGPQKEILFVVEIASSQKQGTTISVRFLLIHFHIVQTQSIDCTEYATDRIFLHE